LLREQGVEGISRRIRRDLENARWLAAQVQASRSGWTLFAPVQLQTVCLRHAPAGWEEAQVDAHNLELVQRINASGEAYLTPAVVRGRQVIRVSIGAEQTERADVARVWELLQQFSA
jgi:aromatic-L-amino-acid decarboxylase